MSSSGENKPVLYTFWASSCAWRVRIALKVRYKHFSAFNNIGSVAFPWAYLSFCWLSGWLVGPLVDPSPVCHNLGGKLHFHAIGAILFDSCFGWIFSLTTYNIRIKINFILFLNVHRSVILCLSIVRQSIILHLKALWTCFVGCWHGCWL